MPDPIRNRFGYGQLWPLRPACRQNRSRSYNYAGSDIPHPIRFRSTKEGLDYFVQIRPGSDLGGLVRIWPDASGLEASLCERTVGPVSGRTQPARYQFPTFRLGCLLPHTARIILCKTRPDLALADRVRFGPNGSGRKQAGVQESPGPLLVNASEPISIGCESDPACLLQEYEESASCILFVGSCVEKCGISVIVR